MVVYRPFPTSNHNLKEVVIILVPVVYRPFPTSNHNLMPMPYPSLALYIVRFLHQTTTFGDYARRMTELYIVRFLHQTTTDLIRARLAKRLYIVRFLHQTTTKNSQKKHVSSCISSVSYIKPQRCPQWRMPIKVVYRPFPTSNHNMSIFWSTPLLVVYRPFPTSNHNLI